MSPEQLQEQQRRSNSSTGARTIPVQRTPTDIATIAVVGLGYVGLPLSLLAASRGFRVVGFDIDEVKVAQLSRREADFLNEEESAQFKHTPTLRITSDERDLDGADAFVVCVPTPVHENRLPDLRPLESASAIVGRHVSKDTLVVIESTVSPGVCEEIALPIIERESGLSRREFYFAHCPERVNPGDARWDVRVIPRVMGGLDNEALERAVQLYGELLDADVVRMGSIREAEAVKMVENAFRDINIAFVNELAISFDRAGIDIMQVIRGASTKPFGFMPFYPGCGVGGHCIPVDPYYLIRYGRENGFEHKFLITARRINSRMPLYTVHLLEKSLRERNKKLEGSVVALLGLAYKRDVPDMRESPGVAIRDALLRRGVTVRTFDPHAPGSTAHTIDEALLRADAAVIATDHAAFRTLTPRHFEKYDVDIVVDGRNCLDKDAFEDTGILYRGIGRA